MNLFYIILCYLCLIQLNYLLNSHISSTMYVHIVFSLSNLFGMNNLETAKSVFISYQTAVHKGSDFSTFTQII